MALRALGDLDAADEVAQETLARALVALRDLTPDDLGAYVGGIALHVIADIGRARQRTVSLDAAPEDLLPSDAPDPLDELCTAGERHRVSEALDRLPAQDRELLRLCYFEGQSPSEIADRTGAPAERIRQRKHRALARLREAFDAPEP
jgi:RNA polymerase sigma factor (sigma-70 family)